MKKVLLISLFIAAIATLNGCASVKTLQATGGSRADGVIALSYEYGMFEKPQINWNQAQTTAATRCEAWGYQSAEAFGGSTSQCQARNGYGNCLRYLVTVKYQCLDH